LRAQLYTEKRKFKAKMSYADKIGVPFVVLLGEDEVEKGLLSVKNMRTGEQQMLSAEEAGALVRGNIEERNNAAPIRG
jgi:histidyl-tRNA synthetase